MGASILQDLVVVMVVAAAVTIIFYRLKQPVVLGYLLAGLVIGPGALALIHDAESIHGLADLGIIFLMFAVGLEFDLKKLRKVGIPAAFVAATEVVVMLVIGYYVGRWMGWSELDSIFLGAVISISSTTIIVKILSEMGKLKEDYSELTFGILIIEDLLGIIIVALLSTMGSTGQMDAAIVGSTIGGVALFVFIFIAVGLVIVPRLIDVVSKFHVEEVLVITVVGLAFGAALMADNLGFSLALGAFLIGAIIAESKAVRRVEHKIVPIRDLFTAMFFVAIGMLIEPVHIANYWLPILLVALATVLGKVVSVAISAYLVGTDGRTSVKTAVALGQIGEFSFIIAGLGLSLNVVRPELPPIAIAVCALTSLATPWMMKYGNSLTEWAAPKLPRWYTTPLAAYTRAVRRLSSPRLDPLERRDARRARHGTRVAIYAAWLFGLLIFAAYLSGWLGAEVGERLSLGSNASRAAAIGFLGLACLPLFVAFTKATEAYVYATAKARTTSAKHLSGRESKLRQPKVVARVIAAVASVTLLAGAARVAWGVHPLGVPNTWLLIPILCIIVATGIVFWRKLERVYGGMEKTLNDLMGSDDDDGAFATEERDGKLRERLPFGLDAREFVVKNYTRTAYSSLKNINLRNATGATVLSVERRGAVIHNPHADWLLLPNDRMMLVGSADQLRRAEGYLNEGLPHEKAFVQQDLRIPASSPAVGHPLGDLHFGDTGARLGYVQRKDGTVFAPSERVTLEPDDHVVVFGPEASMQNARDRFRVAGGKAKMGPGR